MNSIQQYQTEQVKTNITNFTNAAVNEENLEEVVGVHLIGDLDQQLADMSGSMKQELEQKQALRGEIEDIRKMSIDKQAFEHAGKDYVDLNPEEAKLLEVTQSATPITNEQGEVTSYRMTKESFDSAAKSGVDIRDNELSTLNSNSELNMLKLQSLVDQRKNAITLLSNLMASHNKTVEQIINNIK